MIVHTLSEIQIGMWVLTVYDKDTAFQVTSVNYQYGIFEAMDWEEKEKWEKLTTYDVVKIFNEKPTQSQLRLNGKKQKQLQDHD